MLQAGEHLTELHEEPLARCVLVGEHVEGGAPLACQGLQHILVGTAQERGRGYGHRLVPCREHRPAVACPLGDVERFAGAQHGQHGQVVDGAARAAWEAEARGRGRLWGTRTAILRSSSSRCRSGRVAEVAVLQAYEPAVGGEIGNLQPVGALSVGPRGEAAPAHHTRVQAALGEEEAACLVAEPGVLKVAQVARGVERPRIHGRLGGGLPLREHVARAVGKPPAGLGERLAQEAHDQVDGAAVGIAHEAAEGTTAHAVGQAGMVVVVEGAQTLVARDVQPQALGHVLDGERAQAVYFVLFHMI